MADTVGQGKIVQALYNFKGSNNDELCFVKGDIITVTQVVEGGWWEGTLEGTTGWYPSNYVKEVRQDGRTGAISPTGRPDDRDLPMNKRESMLFYHNVVLQSLIDTERTLVTELLTLLQTYLRPLHIANLLSSVEYTHLVGNLEEIYSLHVNLLSALDECAKLPVHQQRIGGEFIRSAPQLKTLYHKYCANHPRAVSVLQRRREELCKFMESQGVSPPGVMVLTTSLSKPFTRLDKYSNVLKELERHTDESHPDRGDTQRAICVYRDIATSCNEVRKQKEIEYEILTSNIKGWEGPEISQLGEVLNLSHVRVQSENGEKKERLLLLFPSVLVMLSVSTRMSGYQYEGNFPLSGMTVNSLEDSETYTHAFELTGPMVDSRIVSCSTKSEMDQLVDAIRTQIKQLNKPQSLQIASSQTSLSSVSHAKMATVLHPQQQPFKAKSTTWAMSCLRPCPPIRPANSTQTGCDATKSPRVGRKSSVNRRKPVEDVKTLEDDAHLLKVIEAYCTSAKTRQTVNSCYKTKGQLFPLSCSGVVSEIGCLGPPKVVWTPDDNCQVLIPHDNDSALLDSPQMLIAEEEKIIVEEVKGNQTVVEEKTLVDTVYSLKDQVKDLRVEQRRMRKELDDEKRARKRLEGLLRKSLRSLVETSWEEGGGGNNT